MLKVSLNSIQRNSNVSHICQFIFPPTYNCSESSRSAWIHYQVTATVFFSWRLHHMWLHTVEPDLAPCSIRLATACCWARNRQACWEGVVRGTSGTMVISHALERCSPWPHVASHHMSISQLLSSCSVLFLSRPRSEGWPHHGRTFSIYVYPLSFW